MIGAALIWLDFRVAVSSTQVNRQMETFSAGNERPQSLAVGAPLVAVVEGNSALARKLRASLEEELDDSGFGAVEVLDALPANVESAILLVELDEANPTWTPVYGRADMTVEIAFSSSGQLDWRDESPVVFSSEQGPQVLSRGEVLVEDVSWGLLSRVGYSHLLANAVAGNIDMFLQELMRQQELR